MNGVPEDGDKTDRRAGIRQVRAPASVAPACVAVYLVVVVGLFFAILHRDDGVFTYTLDDPYIHLALAQGLAHGHYGINPQEASSPSSSILWPFLLVPFARRAWSMYLPLAWNVVFCAIGAWLIGRSVDGWSWRGRWLQDAGTPGAGWWVRLLPAILLMLVANLAGLTFVGMEHGLQVLLAIVCAWGMVEAFAGRRIPWWCLVAAVLGPVVRYENFALVAAIALALDGQARRWAAAVVAGCSLIGPMLFSLFLLSRGLPLLPSSVLVKARLYAFQGGAAMTAITTMVQSVYLGMHEVAWYLQLLLFLLLLWLALREQRRSRRLVLGGAVLAALLQLLIGRYNWFHRYEIYSLIFGVGVACAILMESTRLRYSALVAGLLAFAMPYAIALRDTPEAASNVYQQQYQMHRFMASFTGKVVAVNDLGLVSYERRPGIYVLDLWGLASPEASHQTNKDSDWLDTITRAHSAGLAMIYPDWYAEGAPDDWEPLATMCITGRRISISDRCMVFFSTAIGDKTALAGEVAAFSRTVPGSVQMTLGRDSSGEDDRAK